MVLGRNNCTSRSSLWLGKFLPLQQHGLGWGAPGHQPEVSADNICYYCLLIFVVLQAGSLEQWRHLRDMLADKPAVAQPQEPTQSVTHTLCATHAPAEPLRKQGLAQAWLTQTETHHGRRRSPTRMQPKQVPSVSHVLAPPPRPANIPASKGRKAQPELLGVLQGWSPPGAAGEAGLYSSVWGLAVFISQNLSKMLDKSHSIYTWFCRIVKMLVVTLCNFSSWIKRLFLKPALCTQLWQ